MDEKKENRILVDVHEDQKIIKLLEKENIPHTVQHLTVGDYIFSDVCIERKSVSDFASSSFGHLQEQIMNMQLNQDQIKHIIIVLIGDYDDLFWMRMKVNEASFLGMLSSITMKYKVSLIHFKRPIQFVRYLGSCLNKIDGCIDITKLKRLESKDNTELSLLCALPNISITKARKILEKYQIKMVLQDKAGNKKEVEELKEIDGIGNKIIANLKNHII